MVTGGQHLESEIGFAEPSLVAQRLQAYDVAQVIMEQTCSPK